MPNNTLLYFYKLGATAYLHSLPNNTEAKPASPTEFPTPQTGFEKSISDKNTSNVLEFDSKDLRGGRASVRPMPFDYQGYMELQNSPKIGSEKFGVDLFRYVDAIKNTASKKGYPSVAKRIQKNIYSANKRLSAAEARLKDFSLTSKREVHRNIREFLSPLANRTSSNPLFRNPNIKNIKYTGQQLKKDLGAIEVN